MSIRNVLNNLDLVISKKERILRRPDIGTIVVKDSGICTHNHIPFTLENLVRLWTENTRWKIKHILTYIYGMRHSEQIRQMFFCSLNGMRSINFCI